MLGGLAKRFGLVPATPFGTKVKPGYGPNELTPEMLLAAIARGSSLYGIPRPQRYEDFVRKYGTVVWVYVAVSINMRNTAAVPILVERKSLADPGEWIEAPESRLAHLLARVNDLMTRYDLWEATSANLDLTGNVYWLLFPDETGTPVEIWPLRPDRVEIIPDEHHGIWGYRYVVNTRIFDFAKRWVVHFRDFSPWHDFYGQGALSPTWVEASTFELSSKYRAAFYANSGRPDGVLSTEQQLNKPQIELMRELWQETHTGVDNAHRTAILHSGLKYQIIGATNKEAEMVKDREMNRQDILAGFGVNLAAAGIEVGDVGRREEQLRHYRESTIKPRVTKIIEYLNEFLVTPHFGPTLRIRADWKEYLKEDEKLRSDIDVAEVQAGIRTVNEVRAERGEPPVPWGDEPPKPAPSPLALPPGAGLNGNGNGNGHTPAPVRKPGLPDDITEDELSYRRWGRVRRRAMKTLTPAGPVPTAGALAARMAGEIATVVRAESKTRASDAWLDFLARQVVAERKLVRALKPVYEGAWQASIDAVKASASPAEIKLPAAEDFEPEFEVVGQEYFPDILRTGWKRAGQQIGAKRAHRAVVDFSLSIPGIADYIRNRPRAYARKTARTFWEAVSEIVAQEVEAGSSVDTIAQRLQDDMAQSEGQAQRTARTESVAAMNRGSVTHYQESGVVTGKEWLDSDDSKVRPTHLGVEPVALDQKFVVGGALLDHPGDPSGPAEEIINCRCAVAPVVEEE